MFRCDFENDMCGMQQSTDDSVDYEISWGRKTELLEGACLSGQGRSTNYLYVGTETPPGFAAGDTAK